MLREFPGQGGTEAMSKGFCKSYGLLCRSTVVPAAADDACARTADTIDLGYELVLHKNG